MRVQEGSNDPRYELQLFPVHYWSQIEDRSIFLEKCEKSDGLKIYRTLTDRHDELNATNEYDPVTGII